MSDLGLFSWLIGAALLVVGLTWLGLKHNTVDWGSALVNWIDGLSRLYCKKFHRLQTLPLPVPQDEGALLISNHLSGLDPLLMIAACDRPVRFIIAKEEYHRFGLNWLFKTVGCIPVDRRGRADIAFRHAARALRAGEIVALFPHGKIHLDDDPETRVKQGVFKLAELADCRTIVTRITGIRGAGSVYGPLFLRSRARLKLLGVLPANQLINEPVRSSLGPAMMGREALKTLQ